MSTGEEAGLTLMVQIGFVVGALLSAVLNLADIVPSRKLFLYSAVAGALANLSLVLVDADTVGVGLGLRFSPASIS